MKSGDLEQSVTHAIIATDLRRMVIAYLSYALDDVRELDAQAHQLLQLTIDSLDRLYASQPH